MADAGQQVSLPVFTCRLNDALQLIRKNASSSIAMSTAEGRLVTFFVDYPLLFHPPSIRLPKIIASNDLDAQILS